MVTTSDSCILKKMFGNRARGIDIYEDKCEEELEQEYLDKFYENSDVENGFLDEKAKWQEYVEDYYEKEFEIERQRQKKKYEEGTSGAKKDEIVYSKKAKLGFMAYMDGLEENQLESRDVIQKKAMLIAQNEEDMTENDMIIESCLDWFDLILLYEELVGHEIFYEASMEEIITWFVTCFLGICKESKMPQTSLNEKLVNLVTLYEVVKECKQEA
ncbi:hypothetical protein HanRHA438_Chr02g0095141 [Helianthus annuus]|uniref:Uncharacterized protein n=1 Tax=Helianthus annuus TaxID=4232 RepID=A0A9K3JS53_HELAN|nr:hypothetical protein HanXRQr2_Chr02g0083731 [Helianthus annuus]KAJ0617005.1 hypothetical protein HanIR_Chr02g0096761 [Helianthus annuus]KAJ0620073.1 hypothetical protein HanHA89_Chr02g0078351 [Helianthus annuus]KAJ0630229.1 hypothetical protein HanHA300_Chr00c0383g0753971 [Helianthus annuus]KAJ0804062.1 hypothetical protein HanOQP8_Chr00c215g0792031 [Helianthus annuus]